MSGSDTEQIYGRTIDEQLENLVVTCGTHGELDTEDLSVAFDGRIVCEFCSLNQEMDTSNELDIDAGVSISFDNHTDKE